MEISQLLVALVVAVLGIVVGWLLNQAGVLKQKVSEVVDEYVSEDWEWLVNQAAHTLVRAAYQLFPPERTEEMLRYVQDKIYTELAAKGIEISADDKEKIRAIIEAAVVDFYLALGKPELIGY